MEAAKVALFDRDFWMPFLKKKILPQEAAHISSMLHWQLEKKSVIVYRRDGRSKSPERQDEVQKECGKGSACSPGKPVPKFKCRDAAAGCCGPKCWVGLLRTNGEDGVLCLHGLHWCDYCETGHRAIERSGGGKKYHFKIEMPSGLWKSIVNYVIFLKIC